MCVSVYAYSTCMVSLSVLLTWSVYMRLLCISGSVGTQTDGSRFAEHWGYVVSKCGCRAGFPVGGSRDQRDLLQSRQELPAQRLCRLVCVCVVFLCVHCSALLSCALHCSSLLCTTLLLFSPVRCSALLSCALLYRSSLLSCEGAVCDRAWLKWSGPAC
jgi:hypothetical protein